MKILVAGLGNIFLADDGFGVEVARQLAAAPLPDGVTVVDVGVRGVHLAYQLLDGYDALILVDAVARGGAPGTLYLIEPDLADLAPRSPADAHDLSAEAILGMVAQLGGHVGCVRVVGCEVTAVDEGVGLSEAVERALPAALRMTRALVDRLRQTGAAPDSPPFTDPQPKEARPCDECS